MAPATSAIVAEAPAGVTVPCGAIKVTLSPVKMMPLNVVPIPASSGCSATVAAKTLLASQMMSFSALPAVSASG